MLRWWSRSRSRTIDDQTLIMADVGRKAIAQVEATAQRCWGAHGRSKAQALAKKLATGTWTHDYPITADEARSLGSPVGPKCRTRFSG